MRILIMGLPSSGKTTLARELVARLQLAGKSVAWFNADEIRAHFNDWDFTPEGRLRQAQRMRALADGSNLDFKICDFVAPTPEARTIYDASYIVWMDTVESGPYIDTNRMFSEPTEYDIRLAEKDSWRYSHTISEELLARAYSDFRLLDSLG